MGAGVGLPVVGLPVVGLAVGLTVGASVGLVVGLSVVGFLVHAGSDKSTLKFGHSPPGSRVQASNFKKIGKPGSWSLIVKPKTFFSNGFPISSFTSAFGESLSFFSGQSHRMPNSLGHVRLPLKPFED